MKKVCFLIVSLVFGGFLSGQVLPLPNDGAGAGSPSKKAAFWVDPMTVQPSVFFSPSTIDTRTNRKWWRSTILSPLNYAAIESSIAIDEPLPLPDVRWQVPANPSLLITDPFLIRLWQLRRSIGYIGTN